MLGLLLSSRAAAQLSPPGLDEAVTASWLAGGVRQDLDARRQSVSYVGLGLVNTQPSVPEQFAIFVLNEEIYDRLSKNFTYSYALSLRRQNTYALDSDAVSRDMELRVYGRFSNVQRYGRVKLTTTVRPELRTFYTTRLALSDDPLQFRFRFREQASVDLDQAKEQRIVASAEVLTSMDKGKWRDFGYRESRFCLYWSIDRESWPVVLDVGYMNNLLGRGSEMIDAHYLALDVIWENPFG